MRRRPRFSRDLSFRIWLLPVGMVGGVAMLLFFGLYLLDYLVAGRALGEGTVKALFTYDPDTAENALGNLAQVVVAVLGIVITVVSIVVQLAATRYTPRIADLFFRDRTNLAVLGFFVMTCIFSVWVSLSVVRDFVPQRAITVTLVLVSFSLLLMIPYFGYVFDFLDPKKFIIRIQQQALSAALREGPPVAARQQAVLRGIEDLGDVSKSAVSNQDKMIASSAVDALKDLLVSFLPLKIAEPAEWYEIGDALRQNPDFVAMAPESLADIGQSRTWLEWKVLRQLQAIYSTALADAPDINYLIAIDTRYVGEAALQVEDREALRLVLKFFNTYLRITLNAGKVRTAYNVMNQYRQLAERLLDADRAPLLADIANYYRYYAQVAHGMHLGFVTETIAYDLSVLCEAAFLAGSPAHPALLAALLCVDQDAETAAQELTLRGVRKAQIKLATAYLLRGYEEGARQIHQDMEGERPERLRSIRDELLAVESKDFWEIIDRGTNFDYLEPARKEQLKVFFSWFPPLG